MTLKKQKIVYYEKLKPIKYRFKGNIRLGFRGKRVVEVTKFKGRKS